MRLQELQAGDVLLFARTGFFNRIIRIKTWSVVSHVEVVMTPGTTGEIPKVCASRNGVGVGYYDIDTHGLHGILRPKQPFDRDAAWRWYRTVHGQKYDWLGLLVFTTAVAAGRDNGRMFCSEFATRLLRAGGVEPFTRQTDADSVAPGEFLKSGAFVSVDEDEALFI